VHLFAPDGIPTMDVDGVSKLMFGTTSVTLEFYKTVPDPQPLPTPASKRVDGRAEVPEQRMIVGRLAMPATAFYELVANITLQVRTDRATIDQRNLLYQDTMKRVLDLIEETR
jgi:hypothetical protein